MSITLRLRAVSFDSQTGKLARNVAASDTLPDLLPQDEVSELLDAYEASTATLVAARRLIPALPDIAEKLDSTFRDGKVADIEKLVAELADVHVKHDQAKRMAEALAGIPDRYRDELEQLITSSVDSFTEGLDAQLQALLDEAGMVLAAMPGVTDAQSAIDEKKVAEWERFCALGRVYAALRRDHLEVLRASASPASNFAPRAAATGHAFFLTLDEAVPNYARVMDAGPTPSLDGKIRDPFPFPIHDFTDPAHWMATVAHRARLQPVVEHADAALARSVKAVERAQAESGSGRPAPVARAATDWGATLDSVAGIEWRPKHHTR